jgi:hypothetical protein
VKASPSSSSMVRFDMVALTSGAVKHESRNQERSITKMENAIEDQRSHSAFLSPS